MSEPIGLGIRFQCDPARLRWDSRRKSGRLIDLKPCPWPVTSRLAELRKERSHPSGARKEAAKAVFKSALEAELGGDPGRGERGSIDRAAVLNDRFDCRSRQAARGPRDPGRTARAIEEDLALPCESIGGANERRKPDLGGKADGIGGGRRLRRWAAHFVDGKALRGWESCSC